MKIVVTATRAGLDAPVDARFGRCNTFVFVDPETLESESVPNENAMASGGAGIQAAQLVSKMGAEVVLTGNCGPNAHQTLRADGIGVIVGVTGTVKEAVELFRAGDLSSAEVPNVGAKFGAEAAPDQEV